MRRIERFFFFFSLLWNKVYIEGECFVNVDENEGRSTTQHTTTKLSSWRVML